MKLKNKAAILLAFSMIASLGSAETVYATEMGNELPVLAENGSFEEMPEIGSLERFRGDSIDQIRMDDSGIALTAVGDSYESNNGQYTATRGRYNKFTYASIHDENDTDWYMIEVLNADEPISLFLTNIPSGCDYDMFLVKLGATPESTEVYYNIKSGTAAEELYGNVEEGTYYVVIQASTTAPIENNFSPSNYELYMGDFFQVGQHGYVDTGFDIKFGNIPMGNKTPVYQGWYTYDLSNDASIPTNAVVTKIYLSGHGNGAYWMDFYKMLAAADDRVQFEKKLGQIEVMYTAKKDDTLRVKQKWLIGGSILVSTNFVWKPQILIAYKYPATIFNKRFLRN